MTRSKARMTDESRSGSEQACGQTSYYSFILSVALRARSVLRATARSAKCELVLWGCDLQKWKFFRARNTGAQHTMWKYRSVRQLAVELADGHARRVAG
jgi:hypothetical protein